MLGLCSCSLWTIAVLAFPIYYILRYLWELIPVGNMEKRAIIISGCDTGFGRLLALKCASKGIPVFAGCLTKAGEESLKKDSEGLKGKLVTVPMDVTKDESVKNAVKIVKENLKDGLHLWAVVNNAGIFTIYGPDDWCAIEDYQLSLDVNLLGVIRLTQACKPLIKESKGRIVTVSSVAGRTSVACGAPYSVAKYGVEAYMDAIRQELQLYEVKCCLLEPGAFKTPLIDDTAMKKRIDFVWNRADQTVKEEYGEDYKNNFLRNWNATMHKMGSEHLEYVVDNYYHAITARFPRLRYRCGWDSLLFFIPVSFLPTEVGDFISQTIMGGEKMYPAAMKHKEKTH